MSTTPAEPVTEPAATPPAPPAVETPPAQETDWKAEARKWEQRAKENKAAADQLAKIEEANKTEAQKLADRAEKAEQRAIAAERKAFAAEKGVPVSLITGSTEAEWEAAAAEALAWRGEQQQKIPPAPPATGQGNVGTPVGAAAPQLTQEDVKRLYADKKYDEIVQAQADGRLNTLLGATT